MQQVLAFSLGFQVKAVGLAGIRIERTHVQQPAHAAGKRRGQHFSRQLDMGTLEACTLFPAFVENADQVDDGIAGGQVFNQHVAVVNVCLDEGDVGIHDERAVALTASGENTYLVTVMCQAVDQVLANEAGAAKDANCFVAHVWFLPVCVNAADKCQRSISL